MRFQAQSADADHQTAFKLTEGDLHISAVVERDAKSRRWMMRYSRDGGETITRVLLPGIHSWPTALRRGIAECAQMMDRRVPLKA